MESKSKYTHINGLKAVCVRLPNWVKIRLKNLANIEGISLNYYVNEVLQKHIKQQQDNKRRRNKRRKVK